VIVAPSRLAASTAITVSTVVSSHQNAITPTQGLHGPGRIGLRWVLHCPWGSGLPIKRSVQTWLVPSVPATAVVQTWCLGFCTLHRGWRRPQHCCGFALLTRWCASRGLVPVRQHQGAHCNRCIDDAGKTPPRTRAVPDRHHQVTAEPENSNERTRADQCTAPRPTIDRARRSRTDRRGDTVHAAQ